MKDSTTTFQEAIEAVESLPDSQQENLIKIVKQRLLEHKREILAENINKARDEYRKGDVTVGSVDDLMNELGE